MAQAEYAKSVIDKLIAHPGLASITGRSAKFGEFAGGVGLSTDAAGALALKKQIEGEAFLQAFQSLKGGGHITEIEGEKATQARARLLSMQDEGEFVEALEELKGLIDIGIARTRARAQQPAGGAPPASALPQGVTEDDIQETMRANNLTRAQVLERLRGR
jgi:hypothetical protein